MTPPLGPTAPTSARLLHLVTVTDHRGSLHVAEQGPDALPFAVERMFLVTDVPAGTVRGGHANRTSHEVLVATAGSVVVDLHDGSTGSQVVLDRPDVALHLPPLVWSAQTYGPGSTLVVLASDRFDPAGHIDDFDEYRSLVASTR